MGKKCLRQHPRLWVDVLYLFSLNDYSTWDSSRNTQPPRQTTPSKNHLQFIRDISKASPKNQHNTKLNSWTHVFLAVLNPNRMGVRNTHLPWKTDEKCRQVAETLTILRLHHMLSSAWHLRVNVYIASQGDWSRCQVIGYCNFNRYDHGNDV